jgi:hypothetical protein
MFEASIHTHLLVLACGWRKLRQNNFPPSPSHSVCQHTFAFPPRRVGSVCEHRHNSLIPPDRSARQLTGGIFKKTRVTAERMVDCISIIENTSLPVRQAGASRTVQLFRKPIHWIDITSYLGVTLDKKLTWSTHIR